MSGHNLSAIECGAPTDRDVCDTLENTIRRIGNNFYYYLLIH